MDYDTDSSYTVSSVVCHSNSTYTDPNPNWKDRPRTKCEFLSLVFHFLSYHCRSQSLSEEDFQVNYDGIYHKICVLSGCKSSESTMDETQSTTNTLFVLPFAMDCYDLSGRCYQRTCL